MHEPLEDDLVREAFASVRVPGRFEVLRREPTVIIDGAHNPDGARAAATTLADEFTLTGSVVLVVGLLEGRDPTEMLVALDAPAAGYLVACTPPSPRAIPAAQVAAAADGLGIVAEAVPRTADALRRALALATNDDVVLVAGSLYVVGAARSALLYPELEAQADEVDQADWIRAWDEARRAPTPVAVGSASAGADTTVGGSAPSPHPEDPDWEGSSP